jgi:hypothetical protein
MVSFGAFFGATVMARMALLVERLQFFVEDFAPALYLSFGNATDFYWRLLFGLPGS